VLGIDRPVVFGHSAGGFVALQLALRHPGSAGGLILCHTAAALAPGPGADAPPGPAERGGPEAGAVAARLFAGDVSRGIGQAFDRLVLPLYAAPGHEDVPPRLMALSKINPDIAAHFFRALAPRYDLRPHLGEIAAPALVITGRHDWLCSPAAGRRLAQGLRNARLVELPDAGHFGFSETPAPFLRAVREHLARIGAAGSLGDAAVAPPDLDHLAHARRAVGDARVERPERELEATGLELLELRDERVEAPALLVDEDDVAGADPLGGLAAGDVE
jgi:proline iminopeptidase